MIALAFVAVPVPRRPLRAADRRHQADRLQIQRPTSIFPCMGYYVRSWENPIFRKDRFRNVYPTTSQGEGPRELGHLAARLSGPVSPRARRRMARPARRTRRGDEGRPSRFNWFGTNQQGFDVFAQMVHGTQIALQRRLRVDGHRRRDRHHARRAGRLLRRLGRHAAQPR